MLPSHLPDPELFLPGAGEPSLRWGIVGPGWIASEFATALRAHTRQRILAVASRSPQRADAFAAAHEIERAYGSIEQLMADADVDVVYVATPHSEHLSVGLAAIAAGKHVLIEKPIAVDAAQARQLVAAARTAGVMLMEAMWARYLPQASVIRRLLADGVLGQVKTVLADHGQVMAHDPTHRVYDPTLGGGALLDLGIYPIQFASMVLGPTSSVAAVGELTDTGVDEFSTVVLSHDDGGQSTLFSSITSRTPARALIAGSEGSIELDSVFYIPTSFTLRGITHGSPEIRWRDSTGLEIFDALSWEATAFARYVGEGRSESPLHTLEETVSILDVIDTARAQLGVE